MRLGLLANGLHTQMLLPPLVEFFQGWQQTPALRGQGIFHAAYLARSKFRFADQTVAFQLFQAFAKHHVGYAPHFAAKGIESAAARVGQMPENGQFPFTAYEVKGVMRGQGISYTLSRGSTVL